MDDGSGTLGQPVVVREESVGSDTVDISKANPPMQAVYRGIGAYVGVKDVVKNAGDMTVIRHGPGPKTDIEWC